MLVGQGRHLRQRPGISESTGIRHRPIHVMGSWRPEGRHDEVATITVEVKATWYYTKRPNN